MFTTSIGTPLDPSPVTRNLQWLLAAAGQPRMRFHDLRHGYATLTLSHGVDLTVIRDALGHSTITLTAKRLRSRRSEAPARRGRTARCSGGR